jgi:hypothetical protein
MHVFIYFDWPIDQGDLWNLKKKVKSDKKPEGNLNISAVCVYSGKQQTEMLLRTLSQYTAGSVMQGSI